MTHGAVIAREYESLLRNRTFIVSKPHIPKSCATAECIVKQRVIFGVGVLKQLNYDKELL